MTRNARKTLNDKITNGDNMTFQDAVTMLMHEDSHDDIAQSLGYADAPQMFYYENMSQAENDQLPPPPAVIYVPDMAQDGLLHELAKVDPREVYGDFEPCPLNAWYDTSAELK